MKIADIKLERIKGQAEGHWHEWEEAFVRPLAIYPEFQPAAEEGVNREFDGPLEVDQIFLTVTTDEGLTGLHGPISRLTAFIVETELKGFLIGRDPLEGDLLWEQMSRLGYAGRRGDWWAAVGAVDIALWDVRGKAAGKPVYELLGGAWRQSIPAGASFAGFSVSPELLRKRALEFRDAGFARQKWFFRYGPGSGHEGMKKNIAHAQTLRETLGPDYVLGFDVLTGWDLPYAIKICRELKKLDIAWLEEPLPVNALADHVKLHQETGIPLSCGEHLFTLDEVQPWLDAGILEILQVDIGWTGGITEAMRIIKAAARTGVKIVPHGVSLPAALQVLATLPLEIDTFASHVTFCAERETLLLKNPPPIEQGAYALPAGPGFGIGLDETRIRSRTELRPSNTATQRIEL